MPRIYKSGKEFKGNKNSGDKPDSVKFAQFINTNLANEIGNEELRRIKDENPSSLAFKIISLTGVVIPLFSIS